eukprot:jgi/Tetstr1/435518/TSEL_024422.t1
MAPGPHMCPVYEISREDFRRPFSKWVGDVFRENPGLPMFKVVPPKGWSPRFNDGPPEVDHIDIQTPITQHAFGTRGTYRCVLVENKGMKVGQFRETAESEDHLPPKKGHEDDTLLERAFWSSITINPPMYGSDNPWSLFDPKLRWGWNLRDLGDMLQDPRIPAIPGVTTPMVYFGMWKSFFSWHTEDCDLYSINYLHSGAPKAWYCISPVDRPKFEAMARKEFPALYANCKGFMRHKDLMFSPSMLRTHNVPFMQAKQEEGEFVVLNAGAYHAGFNMGFNCAEAINFALPEWLPHGCAAVPCKCQALSDAVRIDMRLWCPDFKPEPEPVEEPEPSLSSPSASEAEGEEEEEVQQPATPPPQQTKRRGAGKGKAGPAGKAAKGGRGRKAAAGGTSGGVRKRTAAAVKGAGAGAATGGRKRRSRATGRPVGRPRNDGRPAGVGKLEGRSRKRTAGKAEAGEVPRTSAAAAKAAAPKTAAAATAPKAAAPKAKPAAPKAAARPTKANAPSRSARASKAVAASGPVAGRVTKAVGGVSGKRVSGSAASAVPPLGPAPLPAYLQPAAARIRAATAASTPTQSERAARGGRRTATSAAALGKRSLRSTVPVLPHDVGLPDKGPRASGASARATAGTSPQPATVAPASATTVTPATTTSPTTATAAAPIAPAPAPVTTNAPTVATFTIPTTAPAPTPAVIAPTPPPQAPVVAPQPLPAAPPAPQAPPTAALEAPPQQAAPVAPPQVSPAVLKQTYPTSPAEAMTPLSTPPQAVVASAPLPARQPAL